MVNILIYHDSMLFIFGMIEKFSKSILCLQSIEINK
jgi:hypothetical protein